MAPRIAQILKARINAYLYTHWNTNLLLGRITNKPYKKLKADLKLLKQQQKQSGFDFPISKIYPCYADIMEEAGSNDSHYFNQDLYVAQKIFKNNPVKHVDIGSRVDGFVAHVASFREIEVFDIRPLNVHIPNMIFTQADLMDSHNIKKNYTDSISCLHALEHFGLGRYGDEIDFEGFYKGFQNITQILKPKGIFYFSVPLGEQRIEFHAHRVFSLDFLIKMVEKDYDIQSFSYVNDNNEIFRDVEITEERRSNNCNCHFGCAIFTLVKKEKAE